MAVEYKDYYKILGVDRKADDKTLKSAYRKLARKYHPDVARGKDTADRFKEINEAYEVLSAPEKRRRYDTLGPDWQRFAQQTPGSAPGGGFRVEYSGGDAEDFSDFFRTIFGDLGARVRGGGRPGRGDGFDVEELLRGSGFRQGGGGVSRRGCPGCRRDHARGGLRRRAEELHDRDGRAVSDLPRRRPRERTTVRDVPRRRLATCAAHARREDPGGCSHGPAGPGRRRGRRRRRWPRRSLPGGHRLAASVPRAQGRRHPPRAADHGARSRAGRQRGGAHAQGEGRDEGPGGHFEWPDVPAARLRHAARQERGRWRSARAREDRRAVEPRAGGA